MYGLIYLIKNKINGKFYVGQTKYTFNKRYKNAGVGMERVYKYHTGRQKKGLRHNVSLVRAFEKYGNDAFEIIEDYAIADSKEELDVLEISIIKQFDSFKNGYNMSEGGEAVKGLKGALNYKAKSVLCLTTRQEFEAVQVAVREMRDTTTGLSHSSIIRCCAGDIAKAGRIKETKEQLEWVYIEDYQKGLIPCIEKDKENWVTCLTTGEVFKSQGKACEYFNLGYSRISIQLSRIRPIAGYHPETKEPLIFKRYLEKNFLILRNGI